MVTSDCPGMVRATMELDSVICCRSSQMSRCTIIGAKLPLSWLEVCAAQKSSSNDRLCMASADRPFMTPAFW